jgi:hypothetical protein
VPTVTGTVYYVPGKVGNYALQLINTPGGTATNYLRGAWANPTNFSVSFWFNSNGFVTSGYTNLFIAYSTAWSIDTYGSSIQLWSNGSAAITSAFSLTVNTWYHVTGTFQTNGTGYLYLNGAVVGSYACGSTPGTTSNLFSIGTNDTNTGNAFSGYIDDLRFYNYAIVPSVAPPQNWTYCALSGTGQYQVALSAGTSTAACGGNIYYSANYGSTWSLVPSSSAATTSTWSSLAVSNTGQYMLATGANVTPTLSGLSAATWSSNGISWTVSASTTLGGWPVYWIFDTNLSTNRWINSIANYTNTTNTAAATTTIVGLSTYGGDWIQVQSSTPLVLSSYMYACGTIARNPQSFYVVGSNDGSTWYPIHYCASMSANPFNANATAPSSYIPVSYSGTTQPFIGNVAVTGNFTTYPSTTSNSYSYFRVVFRTIFNTSADYIDIAEWYFNFSGGQTYSTNYGATWTNTGTTSVIPTSPSAISGNGQYALTAIGATGQSALINSGYVASPYAPGSGCVAYYPFNDASGSTSISEAIGGYYGSLGGSGTTFGNAGKVGTSVYFNGGGYLTLPSTLYNVGWGGSTTLTSGSIACWVYPTTTASLTGSYIFSKLHLGVSWYSTLSIGQYNPANNFTGTAGKIYFALSSGSATTGQWSAGCSSNTILSLNTWYHIVVTFNGTAVQFYINGVLDNTFYCNWSLTADASNTNMTIGTQYNSGLQYPFYGYIDDFSLWNIALPQSTVTTLYNMQTPTLTSINSAITGTALSYTGQYQVLVTGGTTNNVYYSSNYGSTFTGITVGSTALIGCAVSADGQYYTVSNGTTVYTLNNTTAGNSLAIGYGAGSVNQGQNTIAIGSYAGYQNQVSNSIVLNASGSTLNAVQPGLYVAPIQPATASGASTLSVLGYGTDNQVVSYYPPGYILATSNLNNGANPTFSNTSWAALLFNGSKAQLTFTAPASGKVLLQANLCLRATTGNAYIGFWNDATSVVLGSIFAGANTNSYSTLSLNIPVTGLAGGTTYTVDLIGQVAGGTMDIAINQNTIVSVGVLLMAVAL